MTDVVLRGLQQVTRVFRRRRPRGQPARVLLLRLERIGDLLMTLDAFAAIRSALPSARVDVVVGSWNAPLLALVPQVTVEVMNAPWLARGEAAMSWPRLLRRAYGWRARRYDLVVNFEPDIRSNLLAWLSGAPHRVGYRSGGGGAFLTEALEYLPREHVATNALRLATRAAASAAPDTRGVALALPAAEQEGARARLAQHRRPWVGLHAGGGRAIKQWPVERFREVASRLITECGATVVLTGSEDERDLVQHVRIGLPAERVIDVTGALGLPALAALLQSLDVYVTGDTGPMHLAVAVGTPVVAIFGPSDPARYGPSGALDTVVRIDLPCSPCNRIRLPPARCVGHTPDCLAGISAASVFDATVEVLHRRGAPGCR